MTGRYPGKAAVRTRSAPYQSERQGLRFLDTQGPDILTALGRPRLLSSNPQIMRRRVRVPQNLGPALKARLGHQGAGMLCGKTGRGHARDQGQAEGRLAPS